MSGDIIEGWITDTIRAQEEAPTTITRGSKRKKVGQESLLLGGPKKRRTNPPLTRRKTPPGGFMTSRRTRSQMRGAADNSGDPETAIGTTRPKERKGPSKGPRTSPEKPQLATPPRLSPAQSEYINALSQSDTVSNLPSRSRCSDPTDSRVSSKRSTSPFKSLGDLRKLEKPVEYGRLRKDNLPDAVRPLQEAIVNICFKMKIIPDQLKGEIEGPDLIFGRETASGDPFWEYRELGHIIDASYACMNLSKAEPSWNCDVHSRILRLALAHHFQVEQENITTARIHGPFIPAGVKEQPSSSKMVDFSMVLRPLADGSLDRALVDFVKHQPGDQQSVNQTLYDPLKYSPAGVIIETKTSSSTDDGRVQLGVWIAAWHKRMRELIGPNQTIITIPMILVVGSDWKLFYACDQGTHISCLGPTAIGNTENIHDAYVLLGVLGELATWMETEFLDWIERKLIYVDGDNI